MNSKEELIDIINCIIAFDDTETVTKKGHYFGVIQSDLRKLKEVYGSIESILINKTVVNIDSRGIKHVIRRKQ